LKLVYFTSFFSSTKKNRDVFQVVTRIRRDVNSYHIVCL